MLEAIVLAGGLGTRLKEVVPDLPKPMAPVNGKPFLTYLLDNLVEKKFERIILSVGYMAEKIISHFGYRYRELELVYSMEKKPLGTGGAIKLALQKSTQDHVYIMNGDTYLDFDINSTELMWKSNACPIIIATYVDNINRYGHIKYENNLVKGFIEKGNDGAGVINAGYYIFRKNQFDNIFLKDQFSLEIDYLSDAIKKELFYIFVAQGFFIDIGLPEDYAKARTILNMKN
jgi:D-glycero-alpha-D-manno-heptose 1-phosphate guanylyltransferase